ncbi:MAG: protein kinase [Thermodesulfobacteriota bacterium]|nr:protein kinase [Thermodesulfobacteriota bacterium]
MKGRRIVDTTDFHAIDCGDELVIEGKRYIITGHERERRFGMDDPKFWVKRAIDSETSEKKIIKLSFLERFETSLGGVKITRFRDPEKEGHILEAMENHPYFMHGKVYRDIKQNNIRVLDIVPGPNFFAYIESINMTHEVYFHTMLPGIFRHLIRISEAIRFLHTKGFKHGDIRNDHIIIHSDTGDYVWIDFDYDYETTENPFGLEVFGLGNILVYAIGKGFHTLHMIRRHASMYGDLAARIEPQDFSILDRTRLMNLKKLYPYIPRAVNDILIHFSLGAEVYYEFVDEIIEDLNRSLHSLFE